MIRGYRGSFRLAHPALQAGAQAQKRTVGPFEDPEHAGKPGGVSGWAEYGDNPPHCGEGCRTGNDRAVGVLGVEALKQCATVERAGLRVVAGIDHHQALAPIQPAHEGNFLPT